VKIKCRDLFTFPKIYVEVPEEKLHNIKSGYSVRGTWFDLGTNRNKNNKIHCIYKETSTNS
jgi:hypothetical protein